MSHNLRDIACCRPEINVGLLSTVCYGVVCYGILCVRLVLYLEEMCCSSAGRTGNGAGVLGAVVEMERKTSERREKISKTMSPSM